MMTTLFLQSAVRDPYKLYEAMLRENPVYWDETNQVWGIYSYEACTAILTSKAAQLPAINQDNEHGLNEYALRIRGQFARLCNGIQHEIARQTVLLLFDKMKALEIKEIVESLLQQGADKNEIDWVHSICRQLPVMAVLNSLGFNREDGYFISNKIEQFVKIMQPNKTPAQVDAINETAKEIYTITEKHLLASNYQLISKTLSQKYNTGPDEAVSLCVSNVIGLFIQSYDAGRGVLSNSLLQMLNKHNFPLKTSIHKEWVQKSVIETLRFDPPVHNTRRVAVEDITLNDVTIKKGEAIFVVLAAANRDPRKFKRPNTYHIGRMNNGEHLTFGMGSHRCVANYFSASFATETLTFFLERYKKIQLLEKDIHYEPCINVRLPKSMLISFS
jgi:cytochrome P450